MIAYVELLLEAAGISVPRVQIENVYEDGRLPDVIRKLESALDRRVVTRLRGRLSAADLAEVEAGL